MQKARFILGFPKSLSGAGTAGFSQVIGEAHEGCDG